jgi:hypothetical protein
MRPDEPWTAHNLGRRNAGGNVEGLGRNYESFLRQRGLRVWPKDTREALAMRARLAQDRAKSTRQKGNWREPFEDGPERSRDFARRVA